MHYQPLFAVRRGIRGKEQNSARTDGRTFDIDRLFEAVASGDVRNLDGLQPYLHRNMKKLSDTLCECDVSRVAPLAT